MTLRTVALLVAVLQVAGCRCESRKPPPPVSGAVDAGGTAPEGPARPKPPAELPTTFTWPGVDPQSLDPALIHDMSAWWIAVNLFEGLLVVPPGDGPPRPGVAEALPTPSEDRKTWTFRLRPDALWSDGRPVVAGDFVYAWRRAVDPATRSPNAEDFRVLAGAADLLEGRQTDTSTLGVEAPDDRTLVVRLASPVPYFVAQTATPPYFPVRRDVVERHGDRWTLPGNLVGNGAFTLAKWEPRDRLELVRNEHYWDRANVQLPSATMLHSETEDTALRWYEAGKVHWVNTISPDKVARMLSEGRADLHSGPMLCHVGVLFRLDRPPLDDPKVRRAIAMAIDRDRLVKHVLGRGDIVATQYIPSLFASLAGYEAPPGVPYDPEAARALLSEAGYPGGSGLPTLTYLYNTYDTNRAIAEFLQRSLKENLGVALELENMEWKSFLARTGQGDFQMARGSWCGLSDPSMWLETFRSGAGGNHGGFASAEYDALLERLAGEGDVARRLALVAEGERMLDRAQVIAPLYFPVRHYLLKPWIRGFEPQSMDVHLLKYLAIVPDGPG